MIKCKFKEDVIVNGYTINKGTVGTIINNKLPTPNCCLSANVYVYKWDIKELDSLNYNTDKYSLDGLVISTETQNILFYANSENQKCEDLSDWKVEKILGFIPDTFKPEYGRYKLGDVIEYLNEELSEWVSKNGIFEEVTEEMIENGDISSEFGVGDSMLVNIDEFDEQVELLNKKLECIGFYYAFDGGLRLFD